MSTPAPEPSATPEDQALRSALQQLLLPMARLAVARGLPYAQVEEQLRQAFVQAAKESHPDVLPHRMVSRISTATGLNRREVTRLVQQPKAAVAAPRKRSLATELFAHWSSDKRYLQKSGAPKVLPRQGPEPSFETLAQEVTRDVHPRSLLDELLRLGLATHDAERDQVHLVRDAFVPKGDGVRLMGLLGHNVGDHLSAAVANVCTGGGQHVEQAVWADGLTESSAAAARQAVREQWAVLMKALVPLLEASIEQDKSAPAQATQRIRIGLYSFDEPTAAPPPPAE